MRASGCVYGMCLNPIDSVADLLSVSEKTCLNTDWAVTETDTEPIMWLGCRVAVA